MSTLAKKDYRHINAFLGLKTDFNFKKRKSRNDQCQTHYPQTKFQKMFYKNNLANYGKITYF